MADRRMRAILSGRVQGVWFRANTEKWANGLGLKGFVRNLGSGEVEVVAEGSETALKRLEPKLRRGPQGALVENAKISWADVTNEFADFRILRREN